MRGTELIRLVWLNISQNKFKSIMTSIGIVVGAATIMLVIGIGQGGQKDVAEQFAELNAGEINVYYEYEEKEASGEGNGIFGTIGNFFGGMMGNFPFSVGPGGNMPDFGDSDFNFDGTNPFADKSVDAETETEVIEEADESEIASEILEERLNQKMVILTQKDVEDIETRVPDITGASISYTIQSSIEGGKLLSEKNYNVAGVKEAFEDVSRLQIEEGSFINEAQDSAKTKVCVLGSAAAKELFGSAEAAMNQKIYIDDRTYSVYGVLKTSGTIAGGITLDSTIFVPYETGIKYIAGNDISPKITVVAEDVEVLQEVIEGVKKVLESNYTDISFVFEDSGSKMKAAESSNRILTMLLSAMAAIVFIVGGIGIMNVLFVSVKERTNEIGILKAIGTAKKFILMEFLMESAAISFMGGVLGVIAGFAVTPIIRRSDIRIELSIIACLISLGFAVLTGTVFGLYPAWKASKLEPVEALNAE